MDSSPGPVVSVMVLALIAMGGIALAQSSTPTPPPVPPTVETHPAAIHKGTCQQPTPDPAYSAGDVRTFSNEKLTPIAPADFQGTLKAPPVLSTTDTKLTNVKLSDLLTPQQPYVLIVHQSAQQFRPTWPVASSGDRWRTTSSSSPCGR